MHLAADKLHSGLSATASWPSLGLSSCLLGCTAWAIASILKFGIVSGVIAGWELVWCCNRCFESGLGWQPQGHHGLYWFLFQGFLCGSCRFEDSVGLFVGAAFLPAWRHLMAPDIGRPTFPKPNYSGTRNSEVTFYFSFCADTTVAAHSSSRLACTRLTCFPLEISYGWFLQ